MSFDGSVFGEAVFGEETETVEILGTSQPSIDLDWILRTDSPSILLEWIGTGQPSIDIDWVLATGQPSIPLHWIELNTGQPSIDLDWVFPDVSGFPETTENWSIDFLIDGTSYAARYTGDANINPEEDAARIAKFSILHAAGSVDDMSYIGKPVIINATSGSNTIRLFNGVVSNAEFDPDAGIIDFTCTDDLQGHFENSEISYIDSTVGGKYSKHVFNENNDGWTYCQDRMSTQYKSLHLDVNRTPVLTDLTAKVTPDYTFTDADRFDTPIKLTRATRRDILNRVRMSVDYRFARKRQRVINYVLTPVLQSGDVGNYLSFCEYLTDSFGLPTPSIIRSAIESSGWSLVGDLHLDPMPESGYYYCPNARGWVIADRYSYAFSGQWQMSKRFAQTVTEHYTFDIRANNSIEYVGEVGLEQKFALENEYDASNWESEPFNAIASDLTREASGDYVKDMVDGDNGRAAADEAQEAALAQAVASIKKSHRQNSVTFEIPFHPLVDLQHTVQLTSDYITAKGKVREIVHKFNSDTGAASTQITLALSLHGGSGVVTDTALDAVTPPTVAQSTYDNSHLLGYHMGGESTSVAFDDTWEGWITNRQAYTGNYPRYNQTFKLKTPEITDAFRAATETVSSNTINVDIPEDTLTLSA